MRVWKPLDGGSWPLAERPGMDLTAESPRRWSEELGGVRWLPRLIDKARAAIAGTLGDYLYGQCPIDRALLTAFGLSYRQFTDLVRKSGDSDEKVLEALEAIDDRMDRARQWSDALARRRRFVLFLIDLDDGYGSGWAQAFRGLFRFFGAIATRYARYRWPVAATLLGLELEVEGAADRAEHVRGTDEEPYQWLTPSNVDITWKVLLSAVLGFLILYYAIRFLERIGVVVIIIVGAVFFAYLIYPIIRRLNERLPLIAAILIVYVCIFGLVVLGLSYLIPTITAQVTTLIHDWPSIQSRLQAFINDPHTPLLRNAPVQVRQTLAHLPADILTWLRLHGGIAAGNAFAVVLGTATFLAGMIVIPVLGAYLLYDSENLKRFFMGFIPERNRDSTLNLLAELEKVIGGFIRGQLLVGLSVGILIAIGLMFIHEPYAILIGAIAGALDLIPYIGPVIAAVPAILIGFIAGGPREALLVFVVFVIANQAEGHLIAPNIVSRTLQLSPSAVVLAVLIGGELYGVPGMFVAVPIVGILRVLLLHVIPGSVSRQAAQPVLSKYPREVVDADQSS